MSPALLEIDDLKVFYGKVEALHGVSLRVAEGSIVTVIGPNGAGKSTLLGAIMGLLPSTGRVRYDGSDIAAMEVEARVARGICLVPERRELFGELSVEDNLRLGAFQRVRHGERGADSDFGAVYARFPRLEERRTQLAATLSGGERQMLALGRALMGKPKLLMLDEPSLGLAPRIVREIMHIVADLRKTGVSILLVEQNARAALQVADHGYVLETGDIVLAGTSAELGGNPRVVESYLGLAGRPGERESLHEATFLNPLLAAPVRAMPRHIAIIGAGSIGPDIGYYLKSALPGLTLTLVDLAQPALDAALARFRGYADKAVARGKMKREQADAVVRDVHVTTDYDAIAACDWVLEAATENLDLKRRIFADVEARVSPDAIITSNTSSLPAERIFSQLRNPARATVTHFFAPAWRNPAVEVIDWRAADPALVAHLRRFFCETGKLPLVTADAPCFMLDRIFDNWCNESALLLGQATAAEIDSVAAEFVHAGPFFVLNLAHGNPIIVETNTLQADEEGEHYRPASIFRSVERWVTVSPGKSVPVDAKAAADIRDRLLGVLFSQSVDILDRSIGEPADLDLGCRIALGFKRGPLELMDGLGDASAARVLERFVAERPGMPAPKRALAEYRRFERHVLVDDVDGVKVITLRRPEALNALHDEMTDEILAVIRRHENDDAVAGFVLVGYGTRAFCAGADIGRFPSMLGDAEAAARYARDCSRLLVHLDAMRKPVVAALNGMALGGGFELAMRCHSLVAARDAWMQLPEITLGIVPGIGAMVVPYRRWPAAAEVFHGMLRRAEKLTAQRAHELGIVDELADDPRELIGRAVERVRMLSGRVPRIADGAVSLPPFAGNAERAANGTTLSATAVGLIEKAVREAAAAPTLDAALEIGYASFGASACTAAAREGIGAFSERRSPDFGRTG